MFQTQKTNLEAGTAITLLSIFYSYMLQLNFTANLRQWSCK